ncbi:hypothetical protein B0I33_101329 [Prauserella shujinwangii]|uniref:DNA-binding transcriptional regulator of glucitol operon n=1 Tax=Prauserella shujinwangii TaxID=1453103 RepID=A0A2T0M372_9PSEU|nr:hypothetical protein B0I33_101329 [Prauserella shujinwangii]
MCLLSLVAACALAWWQWERYASAGGTFQNLGYVLQWPLFGLFPAFVFWRIRKLRRREREHEGESTEGRARAAPAAVPAPRPSARHGGPPPDGEDEEDRQLAEYNRYLAELNARDQEVK